MAGRAARINRGSRKVLRLIEDQSRQVGGRIDALLLVGGFAGSEYLFKRVQVRAGGLVGEGSI